MSIFVVTKVGNKWIVGDNSTKNGNGVAEGKTAGEKLFIPSVINGHTIEEIGTYAFREIYTIKEIIIENGIKQINRYSFGDLRLLTSVTIPPSVKFIGYGGVHCYNTSVKDTGITPGAIEYTSRGKLIVNFLPNSNIKYIDDYGISRKENIEIYFWGHKSPDYNSDVFYCSMIKSVKIYSPYIKYFVGVKTVNIKSECTIVDDYRLILISSIASLLFSDVV